MAALKVFLRDALGLVLILSVVFAVFCLLLDTLALFAYIGHEESISATFLHESYYLLAFFIPPYFIAKYINKTEWINDVQAYLLMKSKNEQW